MTAGWDPIDLVLPRLDGYFGSPHRDRDFPVGGDGFWSFVSALCSERHDEAGLAKLRAYFRARAPSHPGDRLNTSMDSWPPGRCTKK